MMAANGGMRWLAVMLALGLVSAGWIDASHGQAPDSSVVRRLLLRDVKTWAIQYRRIAVFEVAASPFDLVVIDYRPDVLFGTEWPFSKADVRLMQLKPDGRRRLVFAYLSVGEAEDYRWYWQRAWTAAGAGRPAWIGPENKRWPGNFPVRFWEPAWQGILFGKPEAYLDRLIDAGFDGVYLDRVDVYQEFIGERSTAEADMVDLVSRLSAHAHKRNPRFLVTLQNAEELTAKPAIRAAIDVFAKEDLFFGINHDGRRNSPATVAEALKPMRALRRAGFKVLLIEYPGDAAAAAEIRGRAAAEGFPLLLADHDLAALAPVFPAAGSKVGK